MSVLYLNSRRSSRHLHHSTFGKLANINLVEEEMLASLNILGYIWMETYASIGCYVINPNFLVVVVVDF